MMIVTGNLPDDIATRKQIIGGLTRDAVVAQAEIARDLDAVHSPTRIASAIVCRGRLDLVEDRKAPIAAVGPLTDEQAARGCTFRDKMSAHPGGCQIIRGDRDGLERYRRAGCRHRRRDGRIGSGRRAR